MSRALLLAALICTGCAQLPATPTDNANLWQTAEQLAKTGEGQAYQDLLQAPVDRAFETCIGLLPEVEVGATIPVSVLLAVNAQGQSTTAGVKPETPFNHCVAKALSEQTLPTPPQTAGATTYPLLLSFELQSVAETADAGSQP